MQKAVRSMHPFVPLMHLTGKEVKQMSFAKLMATAPGRWLRVVAGVILVLVALYIGAVWGIVVGIVGVAAFLAGALNVCLLGPILGAPFSGRRLTGA